MQKHDDISKYGNEAMKVLEETDSHKTLTTPELLTKVGERHSDFDYKEDWEKLRKDLKTLDATNRVQAYPVKSGDFNVFRLGRAIPANGHGVTREELNFNPESYKIMEELENELESMLQENGEVQGYGEVCSVEEPIKEKNHLIRETYSRDNPDAEVPVQIPHIAATVTDQGEKDKMVVTPKSKTGIKAVETLDNHELLEVEKIDVEADYWG
ncbi:MAG: hypothetical protein MUP58_01005 [Candidatus Nanohaloarchaeota archaeon QJJ-9]|nr:hypothetical protein [Candidatus Nanohaloarchaeota archaeon QJJ-9]